MHLQTLQSHKRMKSLLESAISSPSLQSTSGKYGSVTKEFEDLHAQRIKVISYLASLRPTFDSPSSSPVLRASHASSDTLTDALAGGDQKNPDWHPHRSVLPSIIDLDLYPAANAPDLAIRMPAEGICPNKREVEGSSAVVIIDSDEEDENCFKGNSEHQAFDFQTWEGSQINRLKQAMIAVQRGQFNPLGQENAEVYGDVSLEPNWKPSIQFENVCLHSITDKWPNQDIADCNYVASREEKGNGEVVDSEVNMNENSDINAPMVSFIGPLEHLPSIRMDLHGVTKKDDFEDLWKDMSFAMECSKTAVSDELTIIQEEEECHDCDHFYVLEDDLGLVCRICGVIRKRIDTIFDYQWIKGTRTSRTRMPSLQHSKDTNEAVRYSGDVEPEGIFVAADIAIHPTHMKQMKPHQLEGFEFLVRNLVNDKPGGCILAHAPGSGKTFMLISFIQSFLAKYPEARPLVVLPKGILPTWKKEFSQWQVEDIPLFDFYSSKADKRSQQLNVLKSWEDSKSILFLGYKQFTNIVCSGASDQISAACQERLLKVPSLLILDEGHTPRNEQTDVLGSLARVQTPRKVVLSGTLYQNHVKEVITILNLVRPKFLKMAYSRNLVKRILSRLHISGHSRRLYKSAIDDSYFADLIEDTLRGEIDFSRKITVIQDLRELTQNVLHYYKGDFLDELPGLLDFTVLLNLSGKQKETVQKKIRKLEKFKKSSVGSAVYIHPHLDVIAESAGEKCALSDETIDMVIGSIDMKEGIKAKFFLNMLSLCESTGEKLLVFSQYILPLKFLERLLVRVKGWHAGNEMFMISGDSNPDDREQAMERFNSSPDAKVFFGSIKACGEGISLVGASRVLILDVHLNPSVTRQAIGRAFRPGQEKKVHIYRLVAADSPEEEDHNTSFRKELISKLWFEWHQYFGQRDFELAAVDIANCQDRFLESPILAEDIKSLYIRLVTIFTAVTNAS